MIKISFEFESFENISFLSPENQFLAQKAKDAAQEFSYAPYSQFNVGAAIRLTNDAIVIGTNQENAAFPAGICAEQVALCTAANQYKDVTIKTLAVAYYKKDIDAKISKMVLPPCGSCRQVIAEFIKRQKSPIELLLCSYDGPIYFIKNANDLLPLQFDAEML